MNNIVKWVLFIVISIIILGMIFYPKIEWGKQDPDQAPANDPSSSILPVNISVIKPERIEDVIRITGAVLANESVEIRSEVSGKIEKIYFREGQKIKKGTLLLSINDDEIKAQIDRLKFTKKLNEDSEYRQRQLLEKEAISREEYEIALTTLKTVQSEIQEREARLAKHHIRAPFDGTIGLRQVSEGSYLSPSDLVCSLYNINPIKIEFSIPGRYSNEVSLGDTIIFTIEVTDEKFYGEVYAIEPRIDPRTRTQQIRAISNNDRAIMLPGQFAKIEYVLDVIPNALMVTSEAVIPELNGHKLYLFKSGKVLQSAVEIGLRTDQRVQIINGVTSGDTVITTGILQVRQGMPVRINEMNEQ